MTDRLTILEGDAIERLRELPDASVQCCVTSPPYWGLRDYGVAGQLGLEKTPEEYVARMVEVFREVRRVLREDGTCWLNLGDSYASDRKGSGGASLKQISNAGSFHNGSQRLNHGLKPKDLVGIPWRVAFALQADGWYLRSDIIWHKPNPMPESVTDRPTKSHEYLFLLAKSERYYYDAEAVKEPSITGDERRPYGSTGAWELDGRPAEQRHGGKPRNGANSLRGQGSNRDGANGPANRDGRDMTEIGVGTFRNKRTVWTVPSAPYSEAHFATFPPDLIKPCILAGTSARGCCPKCGAGWERIVEKSGERNCHSGNRKFADLTIARRGEKSLETSCLADGKVGVYETTGWQAACSCGETQTVPCTVLDPFAGSGTTGQVALELGRKAILIELNPKYCELIRRRCDVTPGLALI